MKYETGRNFMNNEHHLEMAEDILFKAASDFSGQIVFASSLGVEDQVILDMIARMQLDIPVFTLDTGRLFAETYELLAASEARYKRRVEVYFPQSAAVEEMVNDRGVNLFYDSIENRKRCCQVRKLEPLSRALAPYRAWICGLRREQSVTRSEMKAIEPDGSGRTKINPLIDWTNTEVWEYIRKHDVPVNKLHYQGFESIGCACCTRAVKAGEDIRAGRWWWEQPEQKECGLHWNNGKLVRKNDKK